MSNSNILTGTQLNKKIVAHFYYIVRISSYTVYYIIIVVYNSDIKAMKNWPNAWLWEARDVHYNIFCRKFKKCLLNLEFHALETLFKGNLNII